jgi:hypothetical protein
MAEKVKEYCASIRHQLDLLTFEQKREVLEVLQAEFTLDRDGRLRILLVLPTAAGQMEAILASGEVPPPSLREVAERIGQTYANLRHHLPELAHLISARYRGYQEAQGARTRAHVREEIRRVAFDLHRQGHYPSNNRIADLISNPSALRSRTGQSARNEVLHELGWRT